MNTDTRYAMFYENEKPAWYACKSRYHALRLIEKGKISPYTGRPINFTGEILTYRQMKKRGLLP